MPSDDIVPALNPNLRRAALARQFGRQGRVHIENVLTDSFASHLSTVLEQQTPWSLVLNNGEQALEFDTVSAIDYQSMAYDAWSRAKTGFQFFYHHFPLYKNGRIYPDRDHFLAKLVDFLTGEDFFAFVRGVTGIRSISRITSAATLYKPLEFLTYHDDGLTDGKLVAYVLNMTREWRPDWGGALQFFDRPDHVEEGYLPTFNALNLFRVPKAHAVSQVSAFGGFRYSVSGWLCAD